MKKTSNILIYYSLLLVFLVPQFLIIQHDVTVHHNIVHCDTSCINSGVHLHSESEHCYIHEFQFALSEKANVIEITKTTPPVYNITSACKTANYSHTKYHHYYLRGPPINAV